MRPALVALTLAVSACASRSEPTSSPVASEGPRSPLALLVPAERSGTASSASAGVASASPAVAPRLPELPIGMKPEHFELLAPVCGLAAFLPQGGAPTFGCRSQPPFERPRELPDGEVLEVQDVYDVCAPRTVYRGAFGRPGAEQAIVAFDLCKTDDGGFTNGSQPGFALLLESDGGRWKYVSQVLDINVFDCDPATQPSGQTVLICEDNFGAFGDGAARWLFSLDFSRPAGARVTTFGTVHFNGFEAPCGDSAAAPFLESGVTEARFTKRTVKDEDGDGIPDVAVTVERAHVAPGRALTSRIDAACRGHERVDTRRMLPKARASTLHFKGGPSGFAPTQETAKLLDAWGAESPEFWLHVADHYGG